MAAHTTAWNEASPVGSDLASSLDDFMRAMKLDIRERMAVEHYWNSAIAEGNTQDGHHKEITITPATTNTPILKTNSNQSLTGSNASSCVDLGITWNTTGAPTAIKANITNTASGAASLLFDLQIGGTSHVKFSKSGGYTFGPGSGNVSLVLNGNGNQVLEFQANSVAKSRITNATNEYWDSDGSWNFRTLDGLTTRMSLSTSGDLTVQRNLVTPTIANNTSYLVRNTAGTAVSMLGINGSNAMFVGNSDGTSVGGMTFLAASSYAWNIQGTSYWGLSSVGFFPQTTNAYDIGDTSHRVRTVYCRDINVTNAPTLTGNSGSLDMQGAAGAGAQIALRGGAGGGGSNISLITSSTIPASNIGPTISIGRNSNGSGPVSGALVFENVSGTNYYIWVDNAGKLRIGTSSPAVSDTGGSVVGSQS